MSSPRTDAGKAPDATSGGSAPLDPGPPAVDDGPAACDEGGEAPCFAHLLEQDDDER